MAELDINTAKLKDSGRSQEASDTTGDLHTKEALKVIPEALKALEIQVAVTSEAYPFDYDIGIEIYEPRVQIPNKPNLNHHDIGDSINTPSAIEQAYALDTSQYKSPPRVALLKANKDAIGAAAVIDLKMQEIDFNADLVHAIGMVDRHGTTAYILNPALEQYRSQMTLLDSISFARDVSTDEKVQLVKAVLTDNYPMTYAQNIIEKRNAQFQEARRSAQVTVLLENTLCRVRVNNRFAPEIGYSTGCPIVISHNDRFPKREVVVVEGKTYQIESETETVNKYSISLSADHIPFDMQTLRSRLNQLEQQRAEELNIEAELVGTWGGRATFLGSPDGKDTLLSAEEIEHEVIKVIEEVVERGKRLELNIPKYYEYLAVFYKDNKEEIVEHIRTLKALGVEVTDEDIASACVLGNIDPQHLGGNIHQAAIEACTQHTPPPEGSHLVTLRTDADSVGGMSVLNLGKHFSKTAGIENFAQISVIDGLPTHEIFNRVRSIAKADQHGRGTWPGAQTLPKPGTPPEIESYSGMPAGLPRLIANTKTPLEQRVELMERWLLTGNCAGLHEANSRVQEERDTAIAETEFYTVEPTEEAVRLVTMPEEGQETQSLVVVKSKHRGALGLGYTKAPVVMAYTDNFLFPDGSIGPKLTIAQYGENYIDMKGFLNDIRKIDPGAGGSSVIVGSNQFKPTDVRPEVWAATALRHIRGSQETIASV